MGDSIKLKIGGDTSELEAAVKASANRIQQDSKNLKLSPEATKAMPKAPGVEAVRESAQANRNLSQKLREEKAGLDIINRELARKKALIDEIAKKQEAATKGSREELALIQQKSRAEERLQQTQKVAQIQKTNYDKAQQNMEKANGANSKLPGGLPAGGANGGGLEGIVGKLGFPALVGGLSTAIIQGISQIAGSPSRSIVAGGSAVSSTVGTELSSLYNGSLPSSMAFTKEKSEAKDMANKQEAANRAIDATKTGAGIALGTMAGAMALSAGWTGAGLIAAGGTAVGSLGSLFGSERMRAKTTSQLTKNIFPNYSKQQGEEYENLLSSQNAEDFNKNLQAKKQLNPLKVLAVEDYNKNAQRDLDFQRQMGLSNQNFRGGFKNSVFNAGFDDAQGMGMASTIMGSGGSTRSATGNAALGLQAQRNLDMTNAGSVLGKLSGGLGSAETTKESFVKLLAEGTKVGLDGSEFREENRKFVESAAQAISQSGVSSTGGVDQILSQFGKFFGDKTNTGMEAGKSAYELYRQTSMSTTGPRGTMRAAGMLTDPTISKLGRDSREALFNMPIDQLTPDNPAIIAMAKDAGTTPQKLIDAQNKITANSANQFKNSDTANKNLMAVKSKYGVKSAIGYQGPLSQEAYQELNYSLGKSQTAQVKEHPELGQDQRKAAAFADGMSTGDSRAQNQALEDAKKQQLAAPSSGRAEDDTNKVRAEMARQVNQIFVDMKDSIVPASDAASKFVEAIKKLNEEMSKLPEGQRAGFANKNILPIYGMGAKTMPSAGSPSSGGGSGQ